MFYVQRGQVPHKRHTQFRRDDGTLYAEELFGVEGLRGAPRSSTTTRRPRRPTRSMIRRR